MWRSRKADLRPSTRARTITGLRWTILTVALLGSAGAGRGVAQQLEMTRVEVTDPNRLSELAQRGYAIADVSVEGGAHVAWIVTTSTQRAVLVGAGFSVSTAPADIAALQRQAVHYPDFDTPLTGIADRLASLAASDTLITLDTIGTSLEGRPLLVLKIGPADEDGQRPNVVFAATMHAREWIAPMMALGLIEYLVDSLPVSGGGRSLLQNNDIWFIPVVNPDGYQYTHEVDRLWRKNRRDNPDVSVGVDLNRNFPGLWGFDNTGSSGDFASETYRGAGPASEPETQALIEFHRQYPPDVAISYHSFGNLVLFPYSHVWGILAPDYPVFANLAGSVLAPAIVDRNVNSTRPFYASGPGWQLYPANGDYTEWLYREMGTFAFTVELTAGCCEGGNGYGFVFPDDSAQIAQVVSDNIPFALSLIEAASDPDGAIGPGGTLPPGEYFESAWPSISVVAAPATVATMAVVRGLNGQQTITLGSGPLENGALRHRRTGNASAIRLPGTVDVSEKLRGAVLHYADPDSPDEAWTGFNIVDGGFTGGSSWYAVRDTLMSPEMTTWGYQDLRLAFWTRHSGAIGQSDLRGTIDYSVDGGTSWSTAEVVIGNSFEWYPISVPVTPAGSSLRFRFIADSMGWWIDAVQVIGNAAGRDLVRSAPPLELRVSENPVRSESVYISWPPANGMADVKVFTFRGDLVFEASVPSAQSVLRWDLRNRNGATISNGAYIITVNHGDSVSRKRLFVAR